MRLRLVAPVGRLFSSGSWSTLQAERGGGPPQRCGRDRHVEELRPVGVGEAGRRQHQQRCRRHRGQHGAQRRPVLRRRAGTLGVRHDGRGRQGRSPGGPLAGQGRDRRLDAPDRHLRRRRQDPRSPLSARTTGSAKAPVVSPRTRSPAGSRRSPATSAGSAATPAGRCSSTDLTRKGRRRTARLTSRHRRRASAPPLLHHLGAREARSRGARGERPDGLSLVHNGASLLDLRYGGASKKWEFVMGGTTVAIPYLVELQDWTYLTAVHDTTTSELWLFFEGKYVTTVPFTGGSARTESTLELAGSPPRRRRELSGRAASTTCASTRACSRRNRSWPKPCAADDPQKTAGRTR